MNQEMYWNLKKLQQRSFKRANKPGKYLAWQLKNKIISKIIEGGKEIVDSNGIKRAFFKYYANLYGKKSIDKDKIKKYLEKRKMPKISENIKAILNNLRTQEEILMAIQEAKLGKAPGPDGFAAKFYKKVKEELVPYFELLTNEIRETKEIPETWKEATISLIPKEAQDLTNVKNYRPISLLNNDYKLFAKIISERIKIYLQDTIEEEQAGFLPSRQIKDNIRVVIGAI